MKQYARIGPVLLAATLCLSGCKSTAGSRPAPTVTALPVTPVPPRAGVEATMNTFDSAVLARAMTSARGYLTPALGAQTPPMQLAGVLGLQAVPTSARYTITRLSTRAATLRLTFTTGRGRSTSILHLTDTVHGWRISAISTG